MTYPLAPTMPNFASWIQLCGLRRADAVRAPRADTRRRVLGRAEGFVDHAVVVDPRVGVAELGEAPRPAAVVAEIPLVDQREGRVERDLVGVEIDDGEGQEALRVVP